MRVSAGNYSSLFWGRRRIEMGDGRRGWGGLCEAECWVFLLGVGGDIDYPRTFGRGKPFCIAMSRD